MKQTTKVLLSAVLTIALCVSVISGATFALFTDTAETNIAVNAGKVNVEAMIDEASLELYSMDKAQTGKFENGGTAGFATVNNAHTLTLTNITPGDAVKFNIVVTNNSNVAIKYRLTWTVSGVLSNVLEASVGEVTDATTEVTYTKLVSNVSNWADWATDDAKTKTLAVAVELPTGVNNDYQGAEATINFKVEAVQGNAVSTAWYNTTDTEFTLKNAADLAGLAQIVNEGTDTFKDKTVKLGANIDLMNMLWAPIGVNKGWDYKFNGTFIGTGYTISNLNAIGTSGVGLFGYVGNAAHIEGVTIDGAYVSGNDYVGAVLGTGYLAENCLKNCTVKNATIIATPYFDTVKGVYDGGAKAGAVAGFAINGNITGNKAENCTVTAYRDLGGIVGMASSENREITVSGNTVDGVTLSYVDLNGAAYDDGKVNQNMANIVGRTGGAVTESGNIELNVTCGSQIIYTDNDITYIKDEDENTLTLHLVRADYEGTTVTVPEGVTAIGNYAFAQNSNVETVVLSSTVRDLGRGFDSSTVKKVILNEGLEVISSRAFRSTTALEQVVISSTVKEIEDNAFQKSGIKEIIIPANVETVGETAFGASLIEKVTFEGDISIQGYAFRGCTKLHTVIMNGYDVTFVASTLNGRNSTWFCNGESNNPNTSDIDFYVKNEVIKERVLTAMGAERNNTDVYCEQTNPEDGYYVDEQGNAYAYDNTGLQAALEDKKDIVLGADVTIPSNAVQTNGYGATGVNVLSGQTFDGNGNDFGVNKWGTWDSAINTTGGTIKNVTINKGMRGIFVNHNSENNARVILENVIIDGTVYTISCDQGNNQGLTATNSTFNGWTSYATTIGDVKFVDCNFGEGQGYAFCRPYAPTEFVGCNFEAGYKIDARAAVTFENCTIDGVPLTAENLATLVTSNIANATVK